MSGRRPLSPVGTVLGVVHGGGEHGLGNLVRCRTVVEALVAGGATDRVAFVVSGPVDEPTLRRYLEHPWVKIDSVHDPVAVSRVAGARNARAVLVDTPPMRGLGEGYFQRLRWEAGVAVVALSDCHPGRSAACLTVEGDVYHRLPDRPNPARLVGPRYALLSPVFREAAAAEAAAERRGVLVCFGGSDPQGFASHYTPALAASRAARGESLVVVSNRLDAGALAGEPQHRVLPHLDHAGLAGAAACRRVGLISGGVMMYEAAAAGLPCVVLPQNEDQLPAAQEFHRLGVHQLLPPDSSPAAVADAVERLLGNDAEWRRRSAAGPEVVDGRGAERVAGAIADLVSARRCGVRQGGAA